MRDPLARARDRRSCSAPRSSTSPPTPSPSRSPATPTSSRRCCACSSRSASGARAVRAWSPSAAAARSITDRVPARRRRAGLTATQPDRTTCHAPDTKETTPWPRCSTTTTPTCRSSRAGRSRSSATAARATPTRCRLRDSGVDVRVGLPEGSKSRAKAEAEGLRVVDAGRGGRGGRRDHDPGAGPRCSGTSTPRPIEPNLADGDALFFGHGFNIRFGYIKPPAGVDVVHGRARRAPVTWCAASTSTAAACR